MKIKVIDIMNKIHNEETVPKKIMYDFKTYFYDEKTQDYTDYDRNYGLFSDLLDKQCGIFSCLNDEVEIIEEDKKIPEKFKVHSLGDKDEYGNFVSSPFPTNEEFMDKINEIIDYLKSKGE